MLELSILAVGKQKAGPEKSLIDDYCARSSTLARSLGLSGPKVQEASSGKNEDSALAALVPDDTFLVMLDENGKSVTSRDLAQIIARERDHGRSRLCFAIGGADGHGPALREKLKTGQGIGLSLGKATWPHMLVRVMIAEQIYRAMTILAGHPYHRD